ncbi:MAG: DRTGG domain-containing protein [Desulfobacterales bacterium]|nr:DRTGG domain-containing protein [Desulfobacterales bacterium]
MERRVKGGYCGDLLSEIMANAPEGCVWLTIQVHQNIVAVAVLREMAAIILVGGNSPDEETKAKADAEGIPVLLTSLDAFSLAGRLYAAGVVNHTG